MQVLSSNSPSQAGKQERVEKGDGAPSREAPLPGLTFILIIDGTFFTFLEGFLDQPLNDWVLELSLEVLQDKPPFLLVMEIDPSEDQFQQHF